MKEISQLKVFISCPGDIKNELESISLIVKEINKTVGKLSGYSIELLNWIEDTYTGRGEDPQDVINQQIESEYDILVGMLWSRIGTPTKRASSGTVEEIYKAVDENKEYLIYFNTAGPDSINDLDPIQLQSVNKFKDELKEKGILYKEYNSIERFEYLLKTNLFNLINDKFILGVKPPVQEIPTNLSSIKEEYREITDVINEVESSKDPSIDIDIFELVEVTVSYFGSLTTCMATITDSLNVLSENLTSRNQEINKYRNIKDERLRTNKTRTVVNLLAKELDDFNSRLRHELPTFSENLQGIGLSYPKLEYFTRSYKTKEVGEIRTNSIEFRNTLKNVMSSCAELLREIIDCPPINYKFNKSKRETELVLKDLLKEMLDGQILLDEAFN